MAAKPVPFGEWLPDQPDLGNPGLLEANNVYPDVGFYRPYQPLAEANPGNLSLPAAARGLFYATDPSGARTGRFYAATADTLYMENNTADFDARSGTLSTDALYDWQFAQFGDQVFACNFAQTMFQTFGSGSNFASAAAPDAGAIGVIGQFLVVGNLNEATNRINAIRWSAIGDPTDFPTPNTADATAKQAGEQVLNAGFGTVQAIIGGDQYGLIFQEYGVTRMTYVGPPIVFQFDEIKKAPGAYSKYGVIKAGTVTYYLSYDGFYSTDGVGHTPIGVGKVDKTFLAAFGGGDHARAFYDIRRKCVGWSFPAVGSSTADRLFFFHEPTARWSRATETIRVIDTTPIGSQFGPYAFNSSNVVCEFDGTPGTATLTTGDVEGNAGGATYVSGFKPNVESTGTPPTVTVRLGSRSDLNAAPTYTSSTTPTTRTGIADFRSDAKYHRAETTIVGNFLKATSFEYLAQPSGEVDAA